MGAAVQVRRVVGCGVPFEWSVYVRPCGAHCYDEAGAVVGPWGESFWPSWDAAVGFLAELSPDMFVAAEPVGSPADRLRGVIDAEYRAMVGAGAASRVAALDRIRVLRAELAALVLPEGKPE